ncbi:MAG TPA: CAP domain-containing protein [Anaerolineales bacterium]
MDDYRGLRQEAKRSEVARRRSQRWAGILSNAFLGLASLAFAAGLAVAAAAYGPQVGISFPLQEMGLLGEIAAAIVPSPIAAPGTSAGAIAEDSDPRAKVGLPSPFPSATASPTPTSTVSKTPTETPLATQTPTASLTPTVTLTPSRTPIPSRTPTPSKTPFGTQLPTSTFTASPQPSEPGFPDCSPSEDPAFESALLGLINDEREAAGLPAYAQDGQLRTAARTHSTDMACNGFFSHTGSDGSSVGERVTAEGYEWTQVGELIFATSDTSTEAPQRALDWWMASASHRASILSEEYSDIGIGYIHEPSSPFGGYFTAVFARP